MKHLNIVSLALLMIFTACSKDEVTKTQPCTVTTLTSTLPGKWKLANTGSIMEFKADKTYTDADKALHYCSIDFFQEIITLPMSPIVGFEI